MNMSGFVRNQGNRDSQLKDDYISAECGHMYMMIKMSDLYVLLYVLYVLLFYI